MRSLPLFVLVLSMVACSGEGVEPGPITRRQAAEDYAIISCNNALACGTVTPEDFQTCVDLFVLGEVCTSDYDCEALVEDPHATLAAIDCVIQWQLVPCGEEPPCPWTF